MQKVIDDLRAIEDDKRQVSEYDQLNRRRIFLIDKDFGEGLSAAEKSELIELSQYVAGYVDACMPLPFGELDELERCAEEAKK